MCLQFEQEFLDKSFQQTNFLLIFEYRSSLILAVVQCLHQITNLPQLTEN